MSFGSTTTLTLFYDGIIAIIMAAVPLYFVASIRASRRPPEPGKPKSAAIGGFGVLLALVWLVVAYGAFIEPRMLTVRTQELRIGDGDRRMTVALISDTHLGQYRHADWLRTVVAKVNALHPDAVLIAGDVVSTAGGLGSLPPLRDLKAPLGAYAVLGNWDYVAGAVDVRRGIESQGVEVLTNESVLLTAADGSALLLAGLDDMTYGEPDIDTAMTRVWTPSSADGEERLLQIEPANVPPDAPVVVLSHNPDAVSLAETRGADLVLAGHTHGGQVRLPIVGAVPHLPISIGQRYDEGRFDVGPVQLFITSGVGESGARARLFNPPEIALLTIIY